MPAKQEKACERVKNFRAELSDFREQFDRVRKERDASVCITCSLCTDYLQWFVQQAVQNRTELLGRRPHNTATPENPYANVSSQQSPFRPANASVFGASPTEYSRETHALREQNFMSSTNAQLDEFLDRGRAVLGDLGHQREMLKGTQRKLYSVANTLGISGDTIRMVERRAKQDKWIFWTGVVVFFAFCYLVLRWLRWRRVQYSLPEPVSRWAAGPDIATLHCGESSTNTLGHHKAHSARTLRKGTWLQDGAPLLTDVFRVF